MSYDKQIILLFSLGICKTSKLVAYCLIMLKYFLQVMAGRAEELSILLWPLASALTHMIVRRFFSKLHHTFG